MQTSANALNKKTCQTKLFFYIHQNNKCIHMISVMDKTPMRGPVEGVDAVVVVAMAGVLVWVHILGVCS